MNWICSQLGAREHYAVARALHQEGKMERLYTDFWAGPTWRILGALTGKKNLATRFHPDLSAAAVTGFNLQALKASRVKHANPYEGFLEVGQAFGKNIVQALKAESSRSRVESRESRGVYLRALDSPPIFFGYDTGFLEPACWVNEAGGKTIVSQMDPSRFEVDLVREEEKRWPGWSKRSVEVPESYFRRREEEWSIADLVMVNSDWTKKGLILQGVAEEKIVVVPLAYEVPKVEGLGTKNEGCEERAQSYSRRSTFDPSRTFRVLFLGQVILRKGIQYLIEAAKLLRTENIHFDIVGPIGISKDAVNSAPANMTFYGAVSRDRTQEFYLRADVFVLPTLSDGFAMTQLEAMARGLPVIATANCGEVVTDGVDGLLVEAGNAIALAESIQKLFASDGMTESMRESALHKAQLYGICELARNLTLLEPRLSKGISIKTPLEQ